MATNKRPQSGKGKTEPRQSSDLWKKEEEYRRLNEELEAKTAALFKDADELLHEKDDLAPTPSLLGRIDSDEFLREALAVVDKSDQNAGSRSQRSRQQTSAPLTREVTSARSGKTAKSKPSEKSTIDGKVETFLTEFAQRGDTMEVNQTLDSVLPTPAMDMGSEAQLRFLKAKVRVMQEELDKLSQELHKEAESKDKLQKQGKTLEDERSILQKANHSLQLQLEKIRQLHEEAKSQNASLSTQLESCRKELEALNKTSKQQQSNQSSTEVRLNRALEEIEKYKSQLATTRSASKDSSEQEKKRVDMLLMENRRLEKQKNELMTGFKKQLKLIDVLKRQKMHIEAAKMLQFSEEEFVKCLEWGGT